jgi:hypothetical protein
MKILLHFTRAVVFIAMGTATLGANAQDNCPYSQEFQNLRAKLSGQSLTDATSALRAFAVKNQSPETCEAMAIDQELEKREKLLIKLISTGGSKSNMPAHAVFRCDVFNSKTAQCQSPSEDGTANPNSKEKFSPLLLEKTGSFEIKSQLPNAKLHGIYITTIGKAVDGKPAKKLPIRKSIQWSSLPPSTVLIAIYKTKDAWAYRKVVWYFSADV